MKDYTISGNEHTLVYDVREWGERYSSDPWNSKILKTGIWMLKVSTNQGEATQEFEVVEYLLPPRPTLISPQNSETINITTPILQYELPEGIDRVYIRIEVGSEPEVWLKTSINSNEFQVLEGILETGKNYSWKVHIVKGGDISLRYECISDGWSFHVE